MATPAATPGVSIEASIVGAEAPAVSQRVDARWLMAFAAALGLSDPRYYDTLAAAGPLPHPVFSVCYEWPALVALRDKTVAAALAPLSVHATHRLLIHRPPRADETLVTRARLVGVERRRAGVLVTARLATVDARGAPVTTTDYGSVYRGVALAGDDVRPDGPGAAGERASPGPPAWDETLEIPAGAAHVYTECARIWNPIHTDAAVARAAGLPGPILHGTAMLAFAVTCVVARDLGGEPGRVSEITARFTGMVPLQSRIVVRGLGRAGSTLAFDVVGAAGQSIISDATVRAEGEGA